MLYILNLNGDGFSISNQVGTFLNFEILGKTALHAKKPDQSSSDDNEHIKHYKRLHRKRSDIGLSKLNKNVYVCVNNLLKIKDTITDSASGCETDLKTYNNTHINNYFNVSGFRYIITSKYYD